MIRQTYPIEIITPCFCAGADQARAEIRPPSIRGQLRWWFRVLGGNATEEAAIFGSAAGEEGWSSAIRIAVADFQPGSIWSPPNVDQKTPQSYIWHYARESDKPVNSGRQVHGPRWQTKGAVPPDSTFKLIITQTRSLNETRQKAFDFALSAFLNFGTIGLRATRGLGAFKCQGTRPWRELIEPLSKAGFCIALRQQPDTFSTWDGALEDWSKWLRYKLRKERKADRFSALGGIQPRQASAVRFRPIKLSPREFTWLALEAPHGRVLGQNADKILSPVIFSGAAPSPSERRR